LHLQPSELDLLPFYEYEYTLEIFNDLLKDRNKQEQQNTKDTQDKYNMDGLNAQAQKNMSSYKMPALPNMSMPKL
jgi:hypothetical protein|tara:strand:- start:1231 stop:1455 length:225 start_codon:yes stop_codon:yes gene_type:complete